MTSESRISWRNLYRIEKIPAWLLRRLQNAEEVQSDDERRLNALDFVYCHHHNYHYNIVITGSSCPTNTCRFSDSNEDFPSGRQENFSSPFRGQFGASLPGDMDLDLYQACSDTMILPRYSVDLEMECNSRVVKTKKRQVFLRQKLYHLPFQGHCHGKRHLKKSVQGKTNVTHKESLSTYNTFSGVEAAWSSGLSRWCCNPMVPCSRPATCH